MQLSAGFIGREDFSNIYPFYHPTLLEIDDDTFTAAMLTLVYTERVGKAFRMLQVRENLDHLNPEMKKLQEVIVDTFAENSAEKNDISNSDFLKMFLISFYIVMVFQKN